MFLDIKMPGISGREVIHKAREISNGIIIVVITRYDSPEFSKELEQMGADYMPKPSSVKLLRDKIEQRLESIGKLSLK